MSTDFWEEAYRLFAEALDAAPADRRAVLEARAGGRHDLRDRVAALLDAHDASDDFLRTPVGVAIGSAPPAAAVGPGAVVGVWRLVDAIGAGGMGEVYRALRTDGAFTQEVAVKITKLSVFDRDVARRFRAEREILGALSHPHIVRLIDGGTLLTGQAWLAMEFVNGRAITEYSDANRSTLVERLRLFRQVCAAVEYAHQHGVVHRDIKPANILVTDDGVAKVVDFGVAKLLAADVDLSATQTARRGMALTPNYASPEQLRGLPVTTVSDVYALGVVLYELATASRPYETTGKPLDEVLAIVLDREPLRPSVAAGAGVVDGARPWPRKSDLDAIILKALSKAPEQRYSSAAELSADVGRYLDGRPIFAREPSVWYVASRVVRRHTLAAVAVVSAVLAVVGGLAAWTWQARIAAVERQRAERERQRAEERLVDLRQLANTLIFKIHDAVEPLAGSTPVRQTIVQSALAYLERVAESGLNDALRLELAGAYVRIGNVQGAPQKANLGDRDGAIGSFTRAIELLGPVRRSADLATRKTALETLSGAYSVLSNTLKAQGRHQESVDASRQSVAAVEELSHLSQNDDAQRRRVGSAHFSLALALQGTPDALAEWRRSQEIFETLLEERPEDPDRMRNVALVSKYLKGEFENRGQSDEADRVAARALELDERRLAMNPANRTAQLDLANDLSEIASTLTVAGKYGEADALLRRSLSMRRELSAADPRDVQAQDKVGHLEWRLAENTWRAGHPREARRLALDAERTSAALVALSRDVVTLRDYAAAMSVLAVASRSLGDGSACSYVATATGLVEEFQRLGGNVTFNVLIFDLPAAAKACAAAHAALPSSSR